VRDFEEWIRVRRSVPTIQELHERADAMRQRELQRALRLLAKGEPPERVIDQLSQALTNKFLHDPMSALRAAGDDAEHARLQALLARFYSSDN
jgi:glutamyl-tRNA reductase